MPFRRRHLHLHSFAVCLLLTIGHSETCYALVEFAGREHEVEWRNVARHGDIAVVGEDIWQAFGLAA